MVYFEKHAFIINWRRHCLFCPPAVCQCAPQAHNDVQCSLIFASLLIAFSVNRRAFCISISADATSCYKLTRTDALFNVKKQQDISNACIVLTFVCSYCCPERNVLLWEYRQFGKQLLDGQKSYSMAQHFVLWEKDKELFFAALQ